jgi:hypothetical protein
LELITGITGKGIRRNKPKMIKKNKNGEFIPLGIMEGENTNKGKEEREEGDEWKDDSDIFCMKEDVEKQDACIQTGEGEDDEHEEEGEEEHEINNNVKKYKGKSIYRSLWREALIHELQEKDVIIKKAKEGLKELRTENDVMKGCVWYSFICILIISYCLLIII